MRFNTKPGQASVSPPEPLTSVSSGLVSSGVSFGVKDLFIQKTPVYLTAAAEAVVAYNSWKDSVSEANEEIIQGSANNSVEGVLEFKNQKPEIILMSEFSPLVDSRGNDTDAGKYFNLILSSRKLKLQKTFEDLQEISRQNPEVSQYFKDLYNQNIKVLSTIEDSFKRVLEMFRTQESFVEILDPRSTIHETDYDTSFSKIFGPEFVEENVDEPNKISFLGDFTNTNNLITGSNTELISFSVALLKMFVLLKLNKYQFITSFLLSKSIKNNNLNYEPPQGSNSTIVNHILDDLCFGHNEQFNQILTLQFTNMGSGLINTIRKDRNFYFETGNLIENNYPGYNWILGSTRPSDENSFNVLSLDMFLSNVKQSLDKMKLIKSYGLIPYQQKKTSGDVGIDSTSMEDFINYHFDTFFTKEGVFKFDPLDDISSMVISNSQIRHLDEPFLTSTQSHLEGSGNFRLQMFRLIMRQVVNDGIAPQSTTTLTIDNFSLTIKDNTLSEGGYFITRPILTDERDKNVTISSENIKEFFADSRTVYDNNFLFKKTNETNLYFTISQLVKNFAYHVYRFSLQPLVGDPETIILLYYNFLLDEILKGSFSSVLYATKERGKEVYVYRSLNTANNQTNIDKFNTLKTNVSSLEKNIRRLYCFLYEFFEKNYNQALRLESQLKDPANLNFLKNIWSFLGEKSQKLFTKHQVTISLNQIDDYKRLFESSGVYSQEKIPNLKFDDSTIPSERTEELFKKFVNDRLLRDGTDGLKKILSVGIPSGFINQLISKTSIENDIFRIKVYKVDLTRPAVVYNPQEFKFELSRFVSRDSSLILRSDSSDIKKLFPTKDLSSLMTDNIIQYFRPERREGLIPSFSGEKYSFLTDGDKEEIYSNHITSYMLEIYLRIMNGISLDEPSIKERLSENEILNLSLGIRNILGDQNALVGNFNSSLQGGNLSSSEQIAQSILTPKKFDRVFNFILEDNKFTINKEKSENSLQVIQSDPNSRDYSKWFSFDSHYVTFEPIGWE
jgi:hypothetical protein